MICVIFAGGAGHRSRKYANKRRRSPSPLMCFECHILPANVLTHYTRRQTNGGAISRSLGNQCQQLYSVFYRVHNFLRHIQIWRLLFTCEVLTCLPKFSLISNVTKCHNKMLSNLIICGYVVTSSYLTQQSTFALS